MSKYTTTIGLEVHIELSTDTKIFCGCSTEFGAEPNTNVCPVCMGLPGALPVLNEEVVNYAIKAGLSTNCDITPTGFSERKNYFYPDSPTGYQISQDKFPICTDGYLEIQTEDGTKKIGIEQIHIEEDAGSLVHEDGVGTLINFNRHGVPLIEVVTKPDMNSKEEAESFLQQIRSNMVFIGVSDARMEQGSFRCDVNISTAEVGSDKLGERVEIKNMNSFQSIRGAIEYEERRQRQALENGETIIQETRGYSQDTRSTYSMRTKEDAADYRYQPDPDLVDIVIDQDRIDNLREALPELPAERLKKFVEEYDIRGLDAQQLVSSIQVADFFERAAEGVEDKKTLANLIISELFSYSSPDNFDIPFEPEYLGQIVEGLNSGRLNNRGAKTIIEIMMEENIAPEKIIERENLEQISDQAQLLPIIEEVLQKNQKAIDEYKDGNEKAIQSLIGQVMGRTRGKANPQVTIELIKSKIQED